MECPPRKFDIQGDGRAAGAGGNDQLDGGGGIDDCNGSPGTSTVMGCE